ncbi:MAG: DUF2232 domain-containing protein [Thermodesulfobacteriota bacterium]
MAGNEASRGELLAATAISGMALSLPALFAELAWLQVLTPLPAQYYATLYGWKTGGTVVLAAAGLAGAVTTATGDWPALLFSLIMMPLGFILARAGKKGSLMGAVGMGLVFLVLAWGGVAGLFSALSRLNPYQELVGFASQGLDATLALYRDSGRFTAEDLKAITAFVERIKEQVVRLMPGLLTIAPIATVWLNIVAGQWLLKKRDPELAAWGDLSQWRLPDLLVWPVIAAGALLVIPERGLNTIGLNLGLVMAALYASQGLAIVSHLLNRWSAGKAMRLLVYGLLFIEAHGLLLVAALGLADVWADFRRRWNQREEEPAG